MKKKGVSIIAHFMKRVETGCKNACWEWRGKTNTWGYGLFYNNKRHIMSHRFSYMHFVGPIPDGLFLDHLCKNTLCLNPDHLEPVTPGENSRRSRRTHCTRGHELSGHNAMIGRVKDKTYVARRCRECFNANARRRYQESERKKSD